MTFYLLRYNVPRSFLTPTGNLLVVLDEEYGNPLDISIGTVSITKVCGHVSNSHPPPVISWKANNQISSMYKKKQHGRRSKVQLNCPQKKNISKIIFASFGSPSGDCGSYTTGSCHSPNSRAIVEKVSYSLYIVQINSTMLHLVVEEIAGN